VLHAICSVEVAIGNMGTSGLGRVIEQHADACLPKPVRALRRPNLYVGRANGRTLIRSMRTWDLSANAGGDDHVQVKGRRASCVSGSSE